MAQKQFKIGLSNQDKQNMAQDVYERVLALNFAEYDSAETYNEGDFVVYNDLLYKCLADNVTGTWDATKWQQATLQDLLNDVEGAVDSVNSKANVDGNYPTMTVGMADNLTPYDESAGDDQDVPFILQATGTGNGSQPDFSTGSAALLREKQGNTVVVNQQRTTATISGTGNSSSPYGKIGSSDAKLVYGHKYLVSYRSIICYIKLEGELSGFNMYKLWVTTVTDGKITKEYLSDWDTTISIDKALTEALDKACYEMDLSRPLILRKHLFEMVNFNRTKFLPEHFVESVEFDKLDVEVFETNKKPKRNARYL